MSIELTEDMKARLVIAKPGDVVVITVPYKATMEDMLQIRDAANALLGTDMGDRLLIVHDATAQAVNIEPGDFMEQAAFEHRMVMDAPFRALWTMYKMQTEALAAERRAALRALAEVWRITRDTGTANPEYQTKMRAAMETAWSLAHDKRRPGDPEWVG